jgi:phage integrase family
MMNRLGMEHLPHDGRHTFASLADTAGMNKIAIKKIMGHASNDITEKVYTHKEVSELLANVNMI